MRATQTLRLKLNLLAAGYAVSLCANLVLSTICIVTYFKPVYYQARQDLEIQQRVEQMRALLQREYWLARNPNGVASAVELAEVEERLQAGAAILDKALPARVATEAWLPIRAALNRRHPQVATRPAEALARYQDLDSRLVGLGGQLGQQRYEHMARAARIQQWVITILLASTLVGTTLCAMGLMLIRRWVVGPVTELRTATGQIGRGNLEYRIVPRNSDELGRLGEEINQMCARLMELQAQLLQQERLIGAGETLARLQGNLREPLAEIRALAGSILQDFREDPEVADCQQRIMDTVDRFEGWLNLLRDSFSLESLRPEPMRIGDVLEEVVNALRPLLDRAEVDVQIQVDPGLRIVRVDRLHFPHVVVALVTNAVEASRPGQMVRIGAAAGSDGEWRLSVLDSGSGVPPELCEKIFQPFFTTKPAGNGIGLAMAHKIVKLHGGRLEVESTLGEGSRFAITMPGAA